MVLKPRPKRTHFSVNYVPLNETGTDELVGNVHSMSFVKTSQNGQLKRSWSFCHLSLSFVLSPPGNDRKHISSSESFRFKTKDLKSQSVLSVNAQGLQSEIVWII